MHNASLVVLHEARIVLFEDRVAYAPVLLVWHAFFAVRYRVLRVEHAFFVVWCGILRVQHPSSVVLHGSVRVHNDVLIVRHQGSIV